MNRRTRSVSLLLFGSGFCALIYQIAWLREFRLIFGASTAASAAVVAIFIAGLGVGGLLLGRFVDRQSRPLALYGKLEVAVAVSTALTPLLLAAVRWAYLALGGTLAMGMALGSGVRLVLAALVLAVPTLLMGGTLPAAARAVETEDDAGRRGVAWLYGINTLGAVTGCMVGNFVMLEIFGTRHTLWIACLLNSLVAMIALRMARDMPDVPVDEPAADRVDVRAKTPLPDEPAPAPVRFVLAASAIVGFAFFLMELVWYRMLGPLLGGTVFTFGLILAVALLGIGIGGALYGAFIKDRPATMRAFAYTCLLEAAFIAVPYALGDGVAVLALLTRPLGGLGFAGFILSWAVVAALVVLPAAIVAGVQFPLLVALLGRGRAHVGRQIGVTYVFNTAGAILGSLAGGFGLLPLLSAPGCWVVVATLLLVLGLATIALSARSEGNWLALAPPVVVSLAVALMLVVPVGPTAAWRHAPIGVGRVDPKAAESPNDLRAWQHKTRRSIIWEAEGVESSVALDIAQGLAFVINGKIDGNARGDAPTQVMSGLVGAIIHPNPKKAMVIGLGTGETAGWLGAIPAVEQVDAIELEPAIVDVAAACAAVNQHVLDNPKVNVIIADAREVLLTTRTTYDVIFSEPSNPYRAGIASLFTKEYYEAAVDRLGDDGLFLQWVQAYEVDAHTVRTIYATLAEVFPHVDTWHLHNADLLLVASKRPIVYDVGTLRARVAEEPYRSALANAWRTTGVEGLLARFVAQAPLARAIADAEDGINTDDHNLVEFGFARSIGRAHRFGVADVRAAARVRGWHRPVLSGGDIDWARWLDERNMLFTAEGTIPDPVPGLSPEQQMRVQAQVQYGQNNLGACMAAWRRQTKAPVTPAELAMVGECAAHARDPRTQEWAAALRRFSGPEADVVLARYHMRGGDVAAALDALDAAFAAYQSDPWPSPFVMRRGLDFALAVAGTSPQAAARVYEAIKQPFALHALEERRGEVVVAVASRLPPETCAEAVASFEPHVPWTRDYLALRASCYAATGHPGAGDAQDDFDEYMEHAAAGFDQGLPAAE